MTVKSKGWFLASIQVIMFVIIAFSSALEYKYIPHSNVPAVHFAGIFLMLIASMIFTVTVVSFAQPITPNPVPRKKAVLRTSGVYKFIRHPMYLSAILLLLGVVMYFQAYYSLLWIAILFIFFKYKTQLEERQLSLKFPEYERYKSSTRKLIPFIY
ncbi:MAG: isoprenylcysteine carboxylmethyltransferase family protein [Ignavibacteria bacterium]|nr:isoprenylcysteine carboxylmethyltransferase family protein [Ignavibacteria bacterium]